MTTAVVANAHGNLDTYYQRMHNSLGDKTRVLPFVKGTTVLDVGCGSGDLMEYLAAKGFDVYGLDASPESVLRTAETVGPDRVLLGYADEIAQKFGEAKFDTIICCSVMHEIFSYGNEYDERGRLTSLSHALESMHRALKPSGRLIVRDGVMPSHKDNVLMWVDDPGEVEKFLDYSPFTKGNTDRSIYLEPLGENLFEGSLSSAMEFAFTYTWGPASFEREAQEFYGVFTLEDYARFVEKAGFTCSEKFEYIQPGYEAHLEGKVKFSHGFPASNAVWVYDKQ